MRLRAIGSRFTRALIVSTPGWSRFSCLANEKARCSMQLNGPLKQCRYQRRELFLFLGCRLFYGFLGRLLRRCLLCRLLGCFLYCGFLGCHSESEILLQTIWYCFVPILRQTSLRIQKKVSGGLVLRECLRISGTRVNGQARVF